MLLSWWFAKTLQETKAVMSTSLLYHAFGVRGYVHQRMEFDGGMVLFHVEAGSSVCRCSACGSSDVLKRGSSRRWFRSVPIGTRLTWIVADLPRVQCRECGLVRQIDVGFARPRERHTKAFAQYALELSKHMTIKDVAELLCVSWDTVKDLKKAYLERHYCVHVTGSRPPSRQT
jgi:transposase